MLPRAGKCQDRFPLKLILVLSVLGSFKVSHPVAGDPDLDISIYERVVLIAGDRLRSVLAFRDAN